MKTVIIYSGKYGCTRDCGEKLRERLSGEVAVVNVKENNDITIAEADNIIIGSSIYVGKVGKELQKFCYDHVEQLIKKKVGIFLCCAFIDEKDSYLAVNFPSKLLNHATMKEVFGGEMRLQGMSFIDKMITKLVTKGKSDTFLIEDEKIDNFAKVMEK